MSYDTYVQRQRKESIPNPIIPINQPCPPNVTIEVVHDRIDSALLFDEGARFMDFVYSMGPAGWVDGLRNRLADLDARRV